jgi:hypothetical protein
MDMRDHAAGYKVRILNGLEIGNISKISRG